MNDIVRIKTNPKRGRVAIYNGGGYFGGHAADDRRNDIRDQTRQALAKLDVTLKSAGTDRNRLLSAQIWLKDIGRDFAGMNEIWDQWIDPEHAPARATAQCEMGAPDVLVEIIVTAAVST